MCGYSIVIDDNMSALSKGLSKVLMNGFVDGGGIANGGGTVDGGGIVKGIDEWHCQMHCQRLDEWCCQRH